MKEDNDEVESGVIELEVPKEYADLAEKLDERMEEDMYEELSKIVMQTISNTAVQNMEVE